MLNLAPRANGPEGEGSALANERLAIVEEPDQIGDVVLPQAEVGRRVGSKVAVLRLEQCHVPQESAARGRGAQQRQVLFERAIRWTDSG